MNKRAARILILFLVFAASVGVFTHLMSHETTENATDLDAASLPVLYMKTADTTVNRMYGYRQEMNGVTTRENLTPLPMDRSLTLEIDAKGQKIKNVTYTVESTDGGALIENSVLKSFDEDGSYLKADFQLETAILMNQEYTLKLEVAYGNGQSAWYYTRIVQRNGVEVGDYLPTRRCLRRHAWIKRRRKRSFRSLSRMRRGIILRSSMSTFIPASTRFPGEASHRRSYSSRCSRSKKRMRRRPASNRST